MTNRGSPPTVPTVQSFRRTCAIKLASDDRCEACGTVAELDNPLYILAVAAGEQEYSSPVLVHMLCIEEAQTRAREDRGHATQQALEVLRLVMPRHQKGMQIAD